MTRPKISLEQLMEMVEDSYVDLSNPGICLACGTEVEGVEPDARKYECEECGEHQVFGAEEALLILA